MSHFTVTVVGDDPEQQLTPFHEFECTGRDDQYVIDVDVTDGHLKDYKTDTSTCTLDPSGAIVTKNIILYREPTEEEREHIGPIAGSGCGNGISWSSRDWGDGKGYRVMVSYTPPGFKEVRLSHEKRWGSFKAYLEEWCDLPMLWPGHEKTEDHKYGHVILQADGTVDKVINHTNPNAHWDWYVLGGRWDGYLRNRHGHQSNQERKRNIDVDGMRRCAEHRALETFDKLAKVMDGRSLPDLEALGREHGHKEGRKLYHKTPVIVDIFKSKLHLYGDIEKQVHGFDRELHAKAARDGALATFAAIKDGRWHEGASMGWWGCTSDEKDDWPEQFAKLWDSIGPDELVSIYDCHI